MQMHRVTIRGVERCGSDVVLLRLDVPDGYVYAPGQWFRMELPAGDGLEARTFSFASAPGDPTIDMATRLSDSGFKRALAQVKAGDAVHISAAGGRPRFPTDTRRAVFLAGGVGITPIRSALHARGASGDGYDEAVLFYGNRDETCEPYLSELLGMTDLGVRVVRVLEHPPKGWDGATGFITAELLRSEVADLRSAHWLVAGPPLMVDVMSGLLEELDIPTENRHIERFGSAKSPADSK